MIGQSIYAYVWRTCRKEQIKTCALVSLVAFLSIIPLELQRRIVDLVVEKPDFRLLALLGSIYLVVLLVQGGIKYTANLLKGRIHEEVTRDLRRRTLERKFMLSTEGSSPGAEAMDSGTTASILASESEALGEFASDSLSIPLLQSTTIIWVLGYLIWVEPLIAGLALVVYAPQIILVPTIQRSVNRLARRRTQVVRKLGHEAVDFAGTTADVQKKQRICTGNLIDLIFKIRMIIYRQKNFLTILGNFLNAFGILVILMVGGYMVIRGETNVSTLVVFMSGFQKISDPWDQLVQFYRSVSIARVTFGLVADVIDGTGATETPADFSKLETDPDGKLS